MATDTAPPAVPGPPDPPATPAASGGPTPVTGAGSTPNWLAAIEPARPTIDPSAARPTGDDPAGKADGIVDADGALDRSAPGASSATYRGADDVVGKGSDAAGVKHKRSVIKEFGLAMAQRWAKGGGTTNKRLDVEKARAQAHQVKEARTTTVMKSGGFPSRNGSGGAGGGGGNSSGNNGGNSGGRTQRNSTGNGSSGVSGRGSGGGSGGGRGSSGSAGSPGSSGSGGSGGGRQQADGGKDHKNNGAGGKGASGSSGSGGASGGSGKNTGSSDPGKGSGKGSKDSGAGASGGGSGTPGAAGKEGKAGKDGKAGGAGSSGSGGGSGSGSGADGKDSKADHGQDVVDLRTPLEKSRDTGHRDGGAIRNGVDHVKAYAKGAKDGWDDKKAENAKEHARLDKARDDHRKQQVGKDGQPKPADDKPEDKAKSAPTTATTGDGQAVVITTDEGDDGVSTDVKPLLVKEIDANTLTLGTDGARRSVSRKELRNFKQYERKLEAKETHLIKIAEACKQLEKAAEKEAEDCQKLLEQAKSVKGGEKVAEKLSKLVEAAKNQATEAAELHKQAKRAAEMCKVVRTNIDTRYAPLYKAVVDSDETKPAELRFYDDKGSYATAA
ncbi:hypothetical protein HUF15_40465 [Streptomyces samsunensis]|uniref:hypothetical protein n=1 Tax=Streptomyces malaysiensis TaxID=92644 RepID=UPI001583F30E|nr:hypothetical protein [Streptomyces samsunensis]NUH42895.1 hypothetical protein [Streptomyces samsunensis]